MLILSNHGYAGNMRPPRGAPQVETAADRMSSPKAISLAARNDLLTCTTRHTKSSFLTQRSFLIYQYTLNKTTAPVQLSRSLRYGVMKTTYLISTNKRLDTGCLISWPMALITQVGERGQILGLVK